MMWTKTFQWSYSLLYAWMGQGNKGTGCGTDTELFYLLW